MSADPGTPEPGQSEPGQPEPGTPDTGRVLLRTVAVRKEFPVRGRAPFVAVDNVSLELRAGETLAVVGESGSGKTTLARLMLGLLPPTAGRVEVAGRDLAGLSAAALRTLRRDLQVVLQDPFSSLNPRLRVTDLVAEALVTHEPELRGRRGRAAREDRVAALLTAVGLETSAATRYPHEFSGGQRQRIAIARAVALRPKVIVLDEPTSALDVSVQAQVLDLLATLQREFGLSYVFVSHNLAVVRRLADQVAVMRAGQVVESGPVRTVFDRPAAPYTRALLDAVLDPDPRRSRHPRTVA